MTTIMPTAPLWAVRGSGEAAAAANPVRLAGTISVPLAILPLLPQSGSATGLGCLRFPSEDGGVTPLTPGSCVSDRDPTNPANGLIENADDRLIDARHIAPYGAVQFYAQYFRVITQVHGALRRHRPSTPDPKRPGTQPGPAGRLIPPPRRK